MTTKKKTTKKAVAKKTIAIRSKDNKHNAGSISTAGKKAPTAKKAVAKKAVAKKAVAKVVEKKCKCIHCFCNDKVEMPDFKNVCEECLTEHYGNHGGNIRSNADDRSPEDIAQEEEEAFEAFVEDVTPYPSDFQGEFSLTNLQVVVGPNGKSAWSEDILRNGNKVGFIENRDFKNNRFFVFTDPADRKAWREEIKLAYDEYSINDDVRSRYHAYLEYLAGYTKVGDV